MNFADGHAQSRKWATPGGYPTRSGATKGVDAQWVAQRFPAGLINP